MESDRTRTTALSVTIAAFILALVVAAAFGEAADSTRYASRGNPKLGKKIYLVRCVACHRPDGSGGIKLTGNATPDWRDAKRMSDPQYGDDYLRDCITHGKSRSGMPAWSRQGVRPSDIENLIAFIHTFSARKRPTAPG